MKTHFYLAVLLGLSFLFVCCSGEKNKDEQVDFVKIGNQIWSKNNLSVTTFRNGDLIFEAKTAEEWEKAGIEKRPAFCYAWNLDSFSNLKITSKEKQKEYFGALYNFYAVTDKRGLAPVGWHVPTNLEWNEMLIQQETYSYENIRYTEENYIQWSDVTKYAYVDDGFASKIKNEFNIVPAGCRDEKGHFLALDNYTYSNSKYAGFWTSDENNAQKGVDKYFYNKLFFKFLNKANETNVLDKAWGLSIRLVKDESNVKSSFIPLSDTIKVGRQTWATNNFSKTTYNDGTEIIYASNVQEWIKAFENKLPAYTYYDNDKLLARKFGVIYNFYATKAESNIIPQDYSLPNSRDIFELLNYIKPKSKTFLDMYNNIQTWESEFENNFTKIRGGGFIDFSYSQSWSTKYPLFFSTPESFYIWTETNGKKIATHTSFSYDDKTNKHLIFNSSLVFHYFNGKEYQSGPIKNNEDFEKIIIEQNSNYFIGNGYYIRLIQK